MTQAAISRFCALWPGASIKVVTAHPDRVPSFFPNVQPVCDRGHKLLSQEGSLLGRFRRFLPDLEAGLRTRYVKQLLPLVVARYKRHGIDARDVYAFVEAISSADLVAVPGGSWIMDPFADSARLVLETLAIAQRLGKPTALLGQAIGPVRDPALREVARRVLLKVDFISLRERRASLPFLRSLGIPLEKVVTTGDDAVEPAFAARAAELGVGIGVNMRVASYAEVDAGPLEAVRASLRESALRWKAALIPVPISWYEGGQDASDVRTIKQLLRGIDDGSDGGQHLGTPVGVIQQIGRCRAVVTGSYHGAVFALAQGIPVVGVARSAYYVDKFLGLADQFGAGCEVVLLDQGDLQARLTYAIEQAWQSAEALRPCLLAAARQQAALGRDAYRKLFDILTNVII